MATVNKDFKIKQGLVVEGTNATVGGKNILVEDTSDQYILDLVGGATLITSVDADDFTVTGGELTIAAGSDIARDGDIATALTDYTTTASLDNTVAGYGYLKNADLPTMYSDADAVNAIAAVLGDGIEYDGTFDVQIGDGLALGGGVTGNGIQIDRATVDTWYDASGAAANAQSSAESYASTQAGYAEGNAVAHANEVAGYAQSNAEAYADGLAVNYDVAGAAANALTSAQSYAQSAAANALADANSYTDNALVNLDLSGNYDALGSADTAYNNAIAYAEGYTDNAVAALVDGAPQILDTLNELAEALQDNPNVISTIQDVAAGKQDALTAGDGIDISGNTISASLQGGGGLHVVAGGKLDIDRSVVDGWYDASGTGANAAANAYSTATSYTDNAITNLNLGGTYDALGAADTAYNNAISVANTYANYAQGNAYSYADGLAVNYDAAGSAANALADANSYTDAAKACAIGTAENTAFGYAQDAYANATSYADGLAVNYDASGSAANALADANDYADSLAGNYEALGAVANAINALDTDDIEEGANNLYFTDQRVIDAIDNSGIAPVTVEINNYRKEEAAQEYINTAGTVNLHSFSYPYESAKYLVRVVGSVAGTKHSQLTEILLTTDGNNNIAVTEYGTIHTSANELATFSATYDAGNYILTATTLVDGAEVIAAATMLSWAD
jgi:hypothetical protein